MPFEFGAVVLVPFPFTDQSAATKRPAVVAILQRIVDRILHHVRHLVGIGDRRRGSLGHP